MIGLYLSASGNFAVFNMFTNVRQNCEHFKMFERKLFFLTLSVLNKNVTKLRKG